MSTPSCDRSRSASSSATSAAIVAASLGRVCSFQKRRSWIPASDSRRLGGSPSRPMVSESSDSISAEPTTCGASTWRTLTIDRSWKSMMPPPSRAVDSITRLAPDDTGAEWLRPNATVATAQTRTKGKAESYQNGVAAASGRQTVMQATWPTVSPPYSVESRSAASAALLRCGPRAKAGPEGGQPKNTGSGPPRTQEQAHAGWTPAHWELHASLRSPRRMLLRFKRPVDSRAARHQARVGQPACRWSVAH